jgi:hypothetical protein
MSDQQTDLGFENEPKASASTKRAAKKAAAKKTARKSPAKKTATKKVAAKNTARKKAPSSDKAEVAAPASAKVRSPAPSIQAPKLNKGSDGPVPVSYSTDKDPEWNSPKKVPVELPAKNENNADRGYSQRDFSPSDNKRESREQRDPHESSEQRTPRDQRDSRHSPNQNSHSQNAGGNQQSGGKHRFKQKPFNPNRDNKKKFGGPPPGNKGQDRPKKKDFKNKPHRKPRGDRNRQDETDSVIEYGDLFRLKIYRNEDELAALAKEAARDASVSLYQSHLTPSSHQAKCRESFITVS